MRTELMLVAAGAFVAIGQPLTLTPAADGPAAAPAAVQQGDFRWAARMADGQTLELYGINGEIRVEAASGSEAEVVARKSARRSDPASVEMVVVPHEDGVTICAVYPSSGDRPNECRPGGGRLNSKDNDTKVEWTVRLPDGVHLAAHTVNGDVTVRGAGASVKATTVNGDVDIVTRGAAAASTVNGSIDASLGRGDWDGTMRFATVNGSITVGIPASLSADVEASTVNGAIESDFPITVQGRFGPRTMRGTIGSGGRDLELETVNGSIRLRRS